MMKNDYINELNEGIAVNILVMIGSTIINGIVLKTISIDDPNYYGVRGMGHFMLIIFIIATVKLIKKIRKKKFYKNIKRTDYIQ